MSERNFVRFMNSQGYEYEIGVKNDEIAIDAGAGGVLPLEDYYRYADAECERAYFEFAEAEIRDLLSEAAQNPDGDYLVKIDKDDLISIGRAIPRKIEITGYEMVEKTATACGNSGRVYVPADWIGHRVAAIRLEDGTVLSGAEGLQIWMVRRFEHDMERNL